MITLCAPILQAVTLAPVKQVILEMDSHVLYYNSITLVALDIGAGAECVWVSQETNVTLRLVESALNAIYILLWQMHNIIVICRYQ
jgi:hypothetical protein